MLEAREGDEREPIPIPLKSVGPAVSKKELELQAMAEDLRFMGCEGLLSKPWNLQAEYTMREFRFERGNQWLRTMRRDPDNWTPDVWASVYGFPRGRGEGWAGRQDGLFAGKFRTNPDPKDGFHPGNCRNLRERRMLEFILPILKPGKTQANQLDYGQYHVRGHVQSPARELGFAISQVRGKNLPLHRAETLLPLHPAPLPTLRLLHG